MKKIILETDRLFLREMATDMVQKAFIAALDGVFATIIVEED